MWLFYRFLVYYFYSFVFRQEVDFDLLFRLIFWLAGLVCWGFSCLQMVVLMLISPEAVLGSAQVCRTSEKCTSNSTFVRGSRCKLAFFLRFRWGWKLNLPSPVGDPQGCLCFCETFLYFSKGLSLSYWDKSCMRRRGQHVCRHVHVCSFSMTKVAFWLLS